jgi:hypothetical protein
MVPDQPPIIETRRLKVRFGGKPENMARSEFTGFEADIGDLEIPQRSSLLLC